ncbi:pimeloyl-ACP methyl ester esterase BioH [Thalassotalea agarivorans]|uniref:Pimeloyl-[acyl-carrier protein] methyl ester esterase n=1 Tax=Thalassotalea agarivorans TaxID=349064 RepID=A0A1I0HQ47_THASX|nr:pimeloyl-ACP methyl ester esterase BioH [Thalassotalea agarivorans]SET85388.1 pimeloyl-[acyl-carrier protein] methyl ester esterase [Thalassotalea agarivorans]
MANKLSLSSFGEGQPIVFIHGWGLNSGVWLPIAQELQSDFQVITIDLPGFGQNLSTIPAQYSLTNVAEMIADAIPDNAILVGWSLGGLVATQIALDFPNKVKKLVTVASTPCFVEKEAWPGIKPHLLQGFHSQLSDDIEKTLSNFLKIQAMGSPQVRQDIKQIKQLVMDLPIPQKSTLDDSLSLLDTVDLRQTLVNVQQPFLRLYGKLDSLVPKKAIALINELSPKSDHIVFDKASHAPFISHPETFVETLKNWI